MPVTDDFLKRLPSSPGVYKMLDPKGTVLYVGKATNLRNRVRSYFLKHGDERPTVQYLLSHVDSIETILTDTEKEALILENNLIKQYKPKYNIDLRDDKSFFSLRLNVSHKFPRLTLVRTQKIKPDGERYFGPYSSAQDAKVTLNFIRKLFPLRQCTDRQLQTCKRPCLNCQMRKCLCPCAGKVTQEEYGRMIHAISLLLLGRSGDLLKDLKVKMNDAATELRFEEAARLRDQLTSIERTVEAQNVSFFHLKDMDVAAIIKDDPDVFVFQILSFRKGALLSGESFAFRNRALETEEALAGCIKQFYSAASFVPKEILVSLPIESPELIASWLSELRGSKVVVRVPSRGHGAKLLQLALKNAHDALQREKHQVGVEKTLDRIAAQLKLTQRPLTIEGYDISNNAGSDSVGVKVCFRDGKPDKTSYRKFKIRDYSNQDDPGMIHQTLTRRLSHRDEDPLPDLFLIDGGKSQLNAACLALRESLGQDAPPVVSIAKARAQGADEKFFLPNRKNEVVFPKGDAGLHLLMQVRDEAHRFAHAFHTESRGKSVIKSSLDTVPGIGAKKRSVLLGAMGSVKAILGARDEELIAIRGITAMDVQRIRKHFSEKLPDSNELDETEQPSVFTAENLLR